METQTLNQTEPNFPREDIMQAPFSEEDLQKISDVAEKTRLSGDSFTLEEFKQKIDNLKNERLQN